MKIMAGAITALRRVVDLALIGLIVIVLFGLILGKIVPLTGHQTVIVGGGSMEPAIGLGSAIVIGPVRPADLVAGDIVSLQAGPERTTFTHRIIDVIQRPDGTTWVRTKGDANAGPDPTLVPATAILGRVSWNIPYAGYLLALLSLPVGVIFVLGLAATLLAIAWLFESVEGDTERVVVRVAADASRGEPIAVRGDPPNGDPGKRPGGGSLVAVAMATATPTAMGSFRKVARRTVPEQLARSREVRALRDRWLAGNRGSSVAAPDGD
jgi:signal peptidase